MIILSKWVEKKRREKYNQKLMKYEEYMQGHLIRIIFTMLGRIRLDNAYTNVVMGHFAL